MPDGSDTFISPPAEQHASQSSTALNQHASLQEVVKTLHRIVVEARLDLIDERLAKSIDRLADQSSEPGRLSQPSFQTGIGYAVQDLEKQTGGTLISMPPELRAELANLAATSPGLQDERMQALVAKTSELNDCELILDIRQTAQEVARFGSSQNGQELASHIEALERRAGIVRTMEAPANNAKDFPQSSHQRATSTTQDGPAEVKAAVMDLDASSTSASPRSEEKSAVGTSIVERVNATPSPGSGQSQTQVAAEAVTTAKPTAVATSAQPATTPVAGQPRQAADVAQVQQQSVAERIMTSTRKPQSLDPAPWSVPVPAIGQRIAQFEQRMADGRTERRAMLEPG